MPTSHYWTNNPDCRQRMSKRLLFTLAAANPGRDASIWCGILRDMLAQTPRGKIYRSKLWNRSGSSEPVTLIDAVCQQLLTELEQHEQLPLFGADLLQELAGSSR